MCYALNKHYIHSEPIHSLHITVAIISHAHLHIYTLLQILCTVILMKKPDIYELQNTINSYSVSHDNRCMVGGDGGCRVGEVRAGTTSSMPDHKGFKLQ